MSLGKQNGNEEKFTQTDLEKLIETIDTNHPQLLSLQINGFCIWPTVKIVLALLTREFVEDNHKALVIQ